MPVTRMSSERGYENTFQAEASSSANPNAGSTSTHTENIASSMPLAGENFDIFDWHMGYLSCQRYFLDHAQHSQAVQAVTALVNIQLPFQWTATPVPSFENTGRHVTSPSAPSASTSSYRPPIMSPERHAAPPPQRPASPNFVSLIPYIRRLVITGFDREPILHGFFGDDWRKGIAPLQECERRNYLFAAKSGGWAKVKNQYDIDPYQTVPWLSPPTGIQLAEIENAEKTWSSWLALEDWMVGPRAPAQEGEENYERTESSRMRD